MKLYTAQRATEFGDDILWFTNKSKASKQKAAWKRDPNTVQVYSIFKYEIKLSRKGICWFLNNHTNDS